MLNLSIEPNVILSLFVWNWKTLYFLIWLLHKSLGVAEVTAAKTIFSSVCTKVYPSFTL